MSDFLPPFAEKAIKSFAREIFNQGSTGLDKLDIRLIKAINPKKRGFFVELGANDGIRQSNTYKLQKHFLWTGLLIEPSPQRFVECVKNRSFANIPDIRCAACVPFSFNDRFIEIEDSDLMSVAKGLSVSDEDAVLHADRGSRFLANCSMRHSYGALARTLTSLLDEVQAPADFNLLSLDVEGNELAVLEGLDFQRYKPKWILVETRGPKISEFLLNLGYRLHSILERNTDYLDVLFTSN